jgi:hypothetical protein
VIGQGIFAMRQVPCHVNRLIKLLGSDVILIPCPLGQKATRFKWAETTVEVMADPAHLTKLTRGNIAVVLGSRSGGLCSIDIDDDELLEPFLAQNPRRCATTYSGYAGRGRSIFRAGRLQICSKQAR